jgi:hypothetical protein
VRGTDGTAHRSVSDIREGIQGKKIAAIFISDYRKAAAWPPFFLSGQNL